MRESKQGLCGCACRCEGAGGNSWQRETRRRTSAQTQAWPRVGDPLAPRLPIRPRGWDPLLPHPHSSWGREGLSPPWAPPHGPSAEVVPGSPPGASPHFSDDVTEAPPGASQTGVSPHGLSCLVAAMVPRAGQGQEGPVPAGQDFPQWRRVLGGLEGRQDPGARAGETWGHGLALRACESACLCECV